MKVKIFCIVYHMQHNSLVETVTILKDCSAQTWDLNRKRRMHNLFVTAQTLSLKIVKGWYISFSWYKEIVIEANRNCKLFEYCKFLKSNILSSLVHVNDQKVLCSYLLWLSFICHAERLLQKIIIRNK